MVFRRGSEGGLGLGAARGSSLQRLQPAERDAGLQPPPPPQEGCSGVLVVILEGRLLSARFLPEQAGFVLGGVRGRSWSRFSNTLTLPPRDGAATLTPHPPNPRAQEGALGWVWGTDRLLRGFDLLRSPAAQPGTVGDESRVCPLTRACWWCLKR